MGTNTVFDNMQSNQNQPTQPVVPSGVDANASAPTPSSSVGSTSTVFDSVEPSKPQPNPSQSQATISAYHPTIWDRVENMFREPARARRGDAAFRDNPDAGNRILAPEAFMTESEKQEHPIATAVGEFGGQMTSAENILQLVATEGLGAATPFLKGVSKIIPRLVSAGFSGQMLYNAYKQYPAVKTAFDRGDVAETERLMTHLVLGVGMAALAGQHALKGSAGGAKPSQYEKAQADLRRNESEEFFPTQENPNPNAPKPAAGRTLLRPTTQKIAGVDAPISASQQPNASVISKIAGHLATPGAAREFQQTRTVPAASRQLVSTLGQRLEDINNSHKALVEGEPAPEPVSGTQQASKYQTIDDAVQASKQTVKSTWDKADAIDAREQAAYDQQKKAAIDEHKRLVDAHNENVAEYNGNLDKDESPMESMPFDETDVAVTERPRTLAEIRSAEQQAQINSKSADAAVRQQAYEKDLPKAEKDLDNWFRQHENEISPEEWKSAKGVYRTASRMQEISNSLRGPMLKASETGGSLTGNTLRSIEARINNQAVRRGQSPDAFKQLLGPEAYSNWKNVARVLDPVKGPSRIEQGIEYFATTALAHFAPILAGAGIAGKAAMEFLMNRVLFHPEWGKWFTNAYEHFKQTGEVASEAKDQLGDLMKYTKMTNQELLDAGFTQAQIDKGVHLPGVGGGSQAADVQEPETVADEVPRMSAGESADAFNKARGRDSIVPVEPMAHPQGKDIADAYQSMQHNPETPKVRRSYTALKRDIDEQWDHAIATGFKFEPWDKEGQPYANSKEMKKDVDDNHHLYFFRGGDIPADHPLAAVDPKSGLTYNDKFRAVHDLYGHAAGGFEFGPKGEEAAYKTHAQMFSPEAVPALTTETRGQNNWVNNGPHMRDAEGNILKKDQPGFLSATERPYAEQKAGLLPEQFNDNPKSLRMHHYSNTEGLKETDPEKMGTGQAGAERARMNEPGFSKTTSFGLEGYDEPRIQRGSKHHYVADTDPSNYYDAQEDPEGIWAEGFRDMGATGAEKAVKEAGYHGYRIGDQVRSFEKVPVRLHEEPSVELMNSEDTSNNASGESSASQEALSRSASEKAKGISRVRVLRNGQEVPLFGPDAVDARAGKGETIVKRYGDGREEIQDQGVGANYRGPKPAKDLHASEITTRRPTSTTGDLSNRPNQHADMNAVNQAAAAHPTRTAENGKTVMGYKEKLARTVAGYTGVRYTPEDLNNPDKVLGKFVNHVSNNLEWLYNQVPESIRERTRQWYDSAHELTKDFAKQYGFSHEQAAGVTAALSPQNPWDNNIGLAKRAMDIYRNRQNFAFTPEMEQKLVDLKKVPTQSKAFKGLLKEVVGKKLSDFKDADPDVRAVKQAMWVRLYDEAHNSEVNDQYSPTGEVTGHSPDNRSWIGLDHIAKAIKILNDGSIDSINSNMGFGHKIRNFYNNIINPNSKNGHVTIDSHAVAASHLQPFGSKDVEAMHNFGNTMPGIPGAPKDAATGLKGTYPLYAEAYQQVAKKMGISPRELQSVVWEAVKSLMGGRGVKTPELKARVREIWQDVQDGKLTPGKARDMIKSEAGGFSKPEWMSDEEWEKLGPESSDTSFGDFNE